MVRARKTALIQSLDEFEYDSIQDIIFNSKHRAAQYTEGEEYETEFIIDFRRVYQKLSIPDIPEHHIGYSTF